MAEFTLKKREPEWLKLNIGNESFNIPLATSMTLEEAHSMNEMDSAISFFKKYIRDDVANSLSLLNYRDIITAWKNASEAVMQQGDVAPGES